MAKNQNNENQNYINSSIEKENNQNNNPNITFDEIEEASQNTLFDRVFQNEAFHSSLDSFMNEYSPNIYLPLTSSDNSFNQSQRKKIGDFEPIGQWSSNIKSLSEKNNYIFDNSFNNNKKQIGNFSLNNTLSLPEIINFYVFNLEVFKIDFNSIYRIIKDRKGPYNIKPPFVQIENIKKIGLVHKLWSYLDSIYDDEEDFNETIKKGVIYTNMFNNLNSIKTEKNEDLKRWQEPYEMFKRIKTHIVQEMINSTNTFDDIKYKLKKINYLAINEPIKADFNIALIGKSFLMM